jgi:predicted house-cleaning noncanonical NTP pyrophosphatase (MazG superfamily)
LPAAWVPPFAALPAWLSEEWQTNSSGWLRTAAVHGIDLGSVLKRVTDSGKHTVIIRSSAVGEGLEDRGQYLSIKLASDASDKDAIAAIEKIFGGLVDRGRHASMGICIQRLVQPDFLGHVSNEVRLSSTRNQWKYEIEFPTYVPNKGLNSKFAYPPAENEPPRAPTQKSLRRALRGVCHWVNLRVGNRAHVEWCVSAGRLWALQLDEESPTSPGENPHLMPPTHFGETISPPKDFSCVEPHRIQIETAWKKLNNVRDFWVGAEPPKHRLFYATAEDLKPILASGPLRKKLEQEINHLTCSRAVLRTDCRDPTKRGFNLPRTHTVDGHEAAKWLGETINGMEADGVKPRDIAFILHQYIPARAAAWSYFDPGDSLVRVDCLWGLPDGLQFLSHDSFELDAKTGAELSADVRFKRHFLQEQADGAWRYVPVARQFSRDRVLYANDLREIALTTVAVANRLAERTQIMWFCDLPPELGLGKHLPWYRSRDYLTHTAVERPSLRTRQIRTLDDLHQLADDEGRAILQLQPTADLIRADDQYLDKVIEVATTRNLPVELPGSILGHAYYRLRDAGIMVLSDQPKYRRARGRMSYRKLVRDAIPANIAAGGERVSFGRLARDEAVTALVGKLFEEGLEVSGARDRTSRLEELADVLEVLRGLAALENATWEEIETVANDKRNKRGGFEKQTVLIETERPRTYAADAVRMDGNGEDATLVALHNIGLIAVNEGHLTVPFTRIIPDRGLRAEVPFEGGKLAIVIRATGGGIVVDIDRIDGHEDPTAQPSLFGDN